MATIFAANSSTLMVDGNPVEGVQGLNYRIVRQQGEVFALGSDERLTAYYGATRVQAELSVASVNADLDALTASGAMFQLVATLAHGDLSRSVSFDDCFMTGKGFEISSGGHGETVYSFTATRVREEDSGGAA